MKDADPLIAWVRARFIQRLCSVKETIGTSAARGEAAIIIIIFQRISIMLQRFNSVLLHDTLPVDLPDL